MGSVSRLPIRTNFDGQTKTREANRPPLAGRTTELELLMNALGDALRLQGSLYFLSGEAGIGKTRLLEEFEDKAIKVGCECLVGRCIPGRPSPYLPFVEVVTHYLDNHPSQSGNKLQERNASLAEVFGNHLNHSEAPSGECSSDQMLSSKTMFAFLEFLKTAAMVQPVLVRIEDLHWADSSSLQMLHFIARNLKGQRILLLGTYRPEDLWPDQLGNPHPLKEALRAMNREGLCEELVLKGLNDSEMGCLLPTLLNGQIEPSLLRRLITDCAGNPLYAIEIARLLESEGALELKNGVWLGASKDLGTPKMILEVIQSRLDKVTKQPKHVLEWASVIGLSFNPQTISQAMSLGIIDLLDILETLQSENLIAYQKGHVFQFTHDKVHQAVYNSISPSKKEEMHKVVGTFLEGQRGISFGTLANHFCKAKDDARCIKYSLMAGEEFARKGTFLDAQPFFEQVLAMNDGSASTSSQIARACYGLGCVNLELGNFEAASTYFRTTAEMNLDDEIKTRITGKIYACDEFKDALDQEKYYQSVIARYEALGEHENAIICLTYLTNVQLTLGRINDAVKSSEKGVSLLQHCPSPLAKRLSQHQAGMLNFHLGNTKEAIRDLTVSIELALRSNDSMSASLWGIELSLVLDSLSDFNGSYHVARMANEAAKDLNIDLITLNSSAGLLHSCINSERMEEARSLYNLILNKSKGFKWGIRSTERCLCLASTAEMRATFGEWDKAIASFEKSLRLMKATPNGILLEAIVRSWFAEALEKRGRMQEAQDQIENAINIYVRLGNINQAQKLSTKVEELRRLLAARSSG